MILYKQLYWWKHPAVVFWKQESYNKRKEAEEPPEFILNCMPIYAYIWYKEHLQIINVLHYWQEDANLHTRLSQAHNKEWPDIYNVIFLAFCW